MSKTKKITKSSEHNYKLFWKTYGILISFALLALFNVALMAGLHRLPQGYDMQFHWQEMHEIMKGSLFPHYAMNSFSDSGVAVPTMYPYLFLYPFVIIYHFTKSVTLTSYSFLVIDTFMALLISYFCSKEFNHNRVIRYLFSVIYSMSFSLFLNSFQTDAVGMNFAFVFMPLVLFGFMYWIKDDRWVMLSIGMILIAYSSVIVSAYLVIFIILWSIGEFWLNHTNVQKKHFKNLLKAGLLTLLVTAIFWIPVAKILFNNKLYDMLGDAGNQLNGVSIPKMIESSIDTTLMIKPNSWTYIMTISSLIGLIIGAAYYKKLSSMMKRMYWIAIIVLLVSSNLFPWRFIAKTPFKIIQFPWRLYLIPQVFLAYIVAWFLDQMIKKWRKSKGYYDNKGILLSIIIVVAVICGLQLSEQSTYVSSIGNVRVPASTLMNTRDVTKDYYPKAALPEFKHILNHEAVAGKQRIKVSPKDHGEYKFKANRDLKRVQMPFVMYNGVKYRCEVNGRRIKIYRGKNGLLTVKNVKKGKNLVKIRFSPNISIYFIYILVLLFMVILFFVKNIYNKFTTIRGKVNQILENRHKIYLMNKFTRIKFIKSKNKFQWLLRNPLSTICWVLELILIILVLTVVIALVMPDEMSLNKDNSIVICINFIVIFILHIWLNMFDNTLNTFKDKHPDIPIVWEAILGKAGLPYISFLLAISVIVTRFVEANGNHYVPDFFIIILFLLIGALLNIGVHYLEKSEFASIIYAKDNSDMLHKILSRINHLNK